MSEDLEYAIKQKNQAYYDFMEKESLYNPKSIKEKNKRKEKHKKEYYFCKTRDSPLVIYL
ncbi:MAG: hypothetical protein Q9M40_04375 [Sulfurimonas sp.]|nr:hypothetical protein [Sulfurimonas sp.]